MSKHLKIGDIIILLDDGSWNKDFVHMKFKISNIDDVSSVQAVALQNVLMTQDQGFAMTRNTTETTLYWTMKGQVEFFNLMDNHGWKVLTGLPKEPAWL